MFAAKAGAKHVYGVDMSGIVDSAKKIVEVNGLSDKVRILYIKLDGPTARGGGGYSEIFA